MKNYIEVKDMTKLFTKEILIYSFFDISLKKPLRIVFIGYLVLLLAIWGLPMYLLFGTITNPYAAMVIVLPPFFLARLMSQPIWNGKSFLSWFKCQLKFATSVKKYYDGKAIKSFARYKIDHKITVSRRKDFVKLFNYIQENNKG